MAAAGAAPDPVDRVLKRIAAKADGWLPTFEPDDTGAELVGRFGEYCREIGRDPATVPIEALLAPSIHPDPVGHCQAWQKLGAVQMCANMAGPGVDGVDANLRRLAELRDGLATAGLWTAREDAA